MISPTTKGPLELEITGSTTSFNRRGLHSERLRRWLNVTEQPVTDVRPRHGPLHGPPHQEPQEVAGPPRRLTFSTVYPAPCLVTSKMLNKHFAERYKPLVSIPAFHLLSQTSRQSRGKGGNTFTNQETMVPKVTRGAQVIPLGSD